MITLADGAGGNRLTPESLEALEGALAACGPDPQVRVILLRSGGPVFCLGMDLGRLSTLQEGSAGSARSVLEGATARYGRVLRMLHTSRQPVVCLVTGAVKAGGVGLAAACDVVIASPEATLELGEVLFGLIPANVLPYLLGRRISLQKARYLALSSATLEAAEARRLGLFDEVVPRPELERRLREVVRRMMRSSPAALAELKRFSASVWGKGLAEGSELAQRTLVELASRPETRRGLAAFQEGRTPEWFGRFRPARALVPAWEADRPAGGGSAGPVEEER